jgi:hypothetical protein
MLTWLVVTALVAGLGPEDPWAAPENPDPRSILGEAAKDADAGRHEVALAKLLWFHRNALKYDEALAGVRLSFAISQWHDLGRVYPPAMDALKKTRDDALKEFRRDPDGGGAFDLFHDFASLNEVLGDESRTVKAFVELDATHQSAAESVFNVAREALIKAKNYKLCGKYVRPDRDWLYAALSHQAAEQSDTSLCPEAGAIQERLLKRLFTREVATLLALLAINGRNEEAERIAQKARLEWDDPDFRAAIDSALAGVMPEQRP